MTGAFIWKLYRISKDLMCYFVRKRVHVACGGCMVLQPIGCFSDVTQVVEFIIGGVFTRSCTL
jgi:hypothetical protein